MLKSMRKFLFITILILLSFYNSLLAQSPFTFHNVLIPETCVAYCMSKDNKGLLWIGTGDGLFCYDGYRCFQRKGFNSSSPKGIQVILIENNIIYLGCDNGFYSYNIETNQYNCIIKNITELNALLPYGNKIYIGCKQGLWIWDKTTNKAESVNNDLKQVYSIVEYGEGLLVGTLNGLFFVKEGKVFKRSYSNFVGVIIPDTNNGCYWIGTEGNLFYYYADNDRLTPVDELSGNYIKTIAIDSQKSLYIGTDNGLYIKQGKNIKHICHDSSNQLSIQNNIICDIYIDNLQNLWIGHNVGISMISNQSFCQLWPLGILTNQFGGNVINAISQDKDGNIWMGGTDGLIRYCKDSLGDSADWYKQSGSRYHILHNRVWAIYNDSDGDVWIMTDHGINLYDKTTKKLRNFIVENDDGQFSCRWAYNLYMDNKRNLWIAAYNEGVFVINKERLLASNGCCKADIFYGESNGKLSGTHAYHIAQDKDENIWVSSNKGIDCISTKNYSLKHLMDQSASSMLSDDQQRIWIAYEGGIICFDSEGKVIKDIGFKENDKNIRFVKLIKVENQIWAFTQNDCRIIHPDGHIDIFSLPNINVKSAHYSAFDNKVLVGGMDNVMYLDSKISNQLAIEQKLILSELNVNGIGFMGDKVPAYLNELTLKSDENNLEFCFTDIPDSRSVLTPYSYCFKGINENWIALGSDKKIILNGLPYGKYTLLINSIDGMGNLIHEVYRLPLTIMPPWYLSVWAKTIYILLTVLLVCGILRFYYVRNKLREEKEKRKKILEQQETRSHFFSHLSNELKKYLVNIIVPAEKILCTTTSQQSKVLTDEMRNSATQINALIRQAFDLNNSKRTNNNLYIISVDVVRFCRGFLQRFEESHPDYSFLNYEFQSTTPEFLMKLSILRFDSILNILINYLSRHAKGEGKIQLQIQQIIDQLIINISGQSVEVNIMDIDQIFDRYHQPKALENNSELYLAREYMMDMDGELKVEYSYERKTIMFKIVLPLDKMPEKSYKVVENIEESHDEFGRNIKNHAEVSNDDFLSKVTTTIEKHIIDYDFNVSMLQYELNIGDKMLYRRIKHLTGFSPVEYIRHIRMNRAALLLKEGKFSISEVMYMVGYSNSSYFSKCFQSAFGLTPTKYKQKWNKSE